VTLADRSERPVIDLRSDAQTRPTPAMLEAIASAPLGDDTFGEDPTSSRLERLVAERLGTEAAMLVVSGTMANLLALMVQCRPGDEVFVDADAHVVRNEAGGLCAVAGVLPSTVPSERGHIDPEALEETIRPDAVFRPRPRLVWIENTHNRAGGSVMDRSQMDRLTAVARDHGLAVHVDGARLLNAAVATGRPASTLVAGADTVSLDFTKGLSCPVGATLAGDEATIAAARRRRRAIGGGMRQAGVIAAPCIVALDEMVERLADDHATARRLAVGLATIAGFDLDPSRVETNIVIADVASLGGSERTVAALRSTGVLVGAVSSDEIRLVTHRHIAPADIEDALERIGAAVERIAVAAVGAVEGGAT
jgi:threonine aldolase